MKHHAVPPTEPGVSAEGAQTRTACRPGTPRLMLEDTTIWPEIARRIAPIRQDFTIFTAGNRFQGPLSVLEAAHRGAHRGVPRVCSEGPVRRHAILRSRGRSGREVAPAASRRSVGFIAHGRSRRASCGPREDRPRVIPLDERVTLSIGCRLVMQPPRFCRVHHGGVTESRRMRYSRGRGTVGVGVERERRRSAELSSACGRGRG